MRSTIAWLALVAVLAMVRSAHADPAAVAVTGKAEARYQDLAARAVVEALRAAQWSVPDKPLDKTATAAVGRCFHEPEPPPCVLRAAHGARGVTFLSVDPDPAKGESSLIIVARMVVASGDSVMISRRSCDHCTDDTVTSSAVEAIKELIDRAAVSSGHTVLSVKSTPQGARFSVDGAPVGATDTSIDIAPGTHTVVVEHEGFESATRTVDCAEGKTAEVSVTLQRIGGPEHSTSVVKTSPTPPNGGHVEAVGHRSRVLPATLIVIGGAALVGGVVALAVNESDVSKPKGQDQPQYYTSTIGPGVAMIVGGAVVGGIGGYLWWKYSHSTTAPSASPVAGGAVLGISGTF